MRGIASFRIFTNCFSIWLNKRQLASHVCFCTQSVAICCFGRSWWKPGVVHAGSWTSTFQIVTERILGTPTCPQILLWEPLASVMMLPCPRPMWIMGVRTRGARDEREDGCGQGWGASSHGWSGELHYPLSIVPAPHYTWPGIAWVPLASSWEKEMLGWSIPESALHHDWQGRNAEWEQFRRIRNNSGETVQGTRKEGQCISIQARMHTVSPARFKCWSDGPDQKPGWQEFGKLRRQF